MKIEGLEKADKVTLSVQTYEVGGVSVCFKRAKKGIDVGYAATPTWGKAETGSEPAADNIEKVLGQIMNRDFNIKPFGGADRTIYFTVEDPKLPKLEPGEWTLLVETNDNKVLFHIHGISLNNKDLAYMISVFKGVHKSAMVFDQIM